MLEDQGDITERLRRGTLTEEDIQQLSRLLEPVSSQSIEQSGKFNVSLGKGTHVQIGDVSHGVTLEQIRLIIQEISTLRSTSIDSSNSSVSENADSIKDLPLRKLVLDFATVETINAKLAIIKEIYEAGYWPTIQQPELQDLKQRLRSLNALSEDLQTLAEQGDRLIEAATEAMRSQLDALKLASQDLTKAAQSGASTADLECQQEEAQTFQTFVTRLDDSRAGADWITNNTKALVDYACKQLRPQFLSLNLPDQTIKDFRLSLKHFLEQVSFSLYWGTYEILDSPEIPLVLDNELYEQAFRLMKEGVSTQLCPETLQEIEQCFNYLFERLPFY
jgi:hypothetical protein